MVDFPTPPFAEDTAITLRTSHMWRFSGRPRCRRGSEGGAPVRGRPCEMSVMIDTVGGSRGQGGREMVPMDSHGLRLYRQWRRASLS